SAFCRKVGLRSSSQSIVVLSSSESDHPSMPVECDGDLYLSENSHRPNVWNADIYHGIGAIFHRLRISPREIICQNVLPFRPPSALDEVNNSSLIRSNWKVCSNDRSDLSFRDTSTKQPLPPAVRCCRQQYAIGNSPCVQCHVQSLASADMVAGPARRYAQSTPAPPC